MAVKPEMIKAIFTNLLFLIGVILLIIGFVRGTSTTVKFLVFDKYPLNSYDETRCENLQYNRPYPVSAEKEPEPPTQEEIDKCLAGLERDRKLQMVEDVTLSLSLLFAGIVLTASFRRFIFDSLKK